MNRRINITSVVLFISALALGWLVGRYALKETWTSPHRTQQMQIEMKELRKFIDSRCDGCTPDLIACTVERRNLAAELNVRCKNVIKYAVALELENSWLNKLVDHCKCDRNSVSRD
jgi:hypothetical protein